MSRGDWGLEAAESLMLNPRAPSSQCGVWGLCSRDSSQSWSPGPGTSLCVLGKRNSPQDGFHALIRVPVRACDTVISFFLSKKGRGVGWWADPRPWQTCWPGLWQPHWVSGDSGRARERGLFLSLPLVHAFPQSIGASASLQRPRHWGQIRWSDAACV